MLGTISADEVGEISGGMLHQSVEVRVNRMVTAIRPFDHLRAGVST